MASSNDERGDGGFATPAATVVSLALAIVASAVTARSVMELRLARTDLGRVGADYALAGAQQEAALATLTAKQQTRLAWTLSTSAGPVAVLAEPQAPKLSLAAAARMDGVTLRRLGVADPAELRDRLRALARTNPSDFDVEGADSAPLWRACSRSIVSPYGAAASGGTIRAATPVEGALSWRIGQTWRLRVTAADGWRDDRIIRFTGDPVHPAGVVERRLSRGGPGEETCEKLFASKRAA